MSTSTEKKTIIHVPHPTLRQKSRAVTTVDDTLVQFIENLEYTLDQKRNPRGVGLSAPQVDNELAIFSTLLSREGVRSEHAIMRTFINPRVIKHSESKTFGPNLSDPILEGCLSIPKLYGPVPRFEWVEYEFETIEKGVLKTHSERFEAYAARVMQHEFDHLQGTLFTDYILEFNLPLYSDESGKLKEIDRRIAEKF